MPDETTKSTTWQFYRACKRTLGMPVLNKIYSGLKGKKCQTCGERVVETRERQINRWCANPMYTESNQPNPVDRLEILLGRMMDKGEEDAVRGLVARFAGIAGCRLVCIDTETDKDTIEKELLDNLDALAEYSRVVTDPDATEFQKRAAAMNVISEIQQDAIFY